MEFSFCGLTEMAMKCLGIDDDDDENDEAFWSEDGSHGYGCFSFASVKANSPTQDFSHVYVGPGTFFGVYDGHYGDQAAKFVSERIMDRIIALALERKGLSEDVLRDAITGLDNEFVDNARELLLPSTVGTCCAIGLIWGKTLCVADIGDSRVIRGRPGENNLTVDHSGVVPPVREEPFDPRSEIQPDDPGVFFHDGKAWRTTGGMMPVSKCIGDGFVKMNDCSKDRVHVATYDLDGDDKFLICATHGLWQHLSVEKAIEIVANAESKYEIARKLARHAMKNSVANVESMRYTDLKHLKPGERRAYHDDMTVIVIYLGMLRDALDDYYAARLVLPFKSFSERSMFDKLHRTKFLAKGEGDEKEEARERSGSSGTCSEAEGKGREGAAAGGSSGTTT